MKKNIDMMVHLLEKNNIPLHKSARKKDGGSCLDNKERCHSLVVGSSDSSSFIIELGDSRHMDTIQDFFTAMYSNSGPSIHMGDDSEIQAKGIGMIDLEDGYFNNVLFVPDLAANILSLYQMTHTGEFKRVTFTPNAMEIT